MPLPGGFFTGRPTDRDGYDAARPRPTVAEARHANGSDHVRPRPAL